MFSGLKGIKIYIAGLIGEEINLKICDGTPLWSSGCQSTCHGGGAGLIPGPGRFHMPLGS